MMAEQDHAIRRSLPARFWKPLFAGAAAAAALAFAVAPGWFTERSTAVQQPEPIANVQPRTDLPEPPTTIEDTSNGNAHEAVGVARLEQDIRIEEIEMLVDDAPQGLGNNMTGRTGASAFSARRVGRLLPRSFSLAYLVSSSSLVFDGHITEITPVGGQGLADLRWRVNRVLKGNSQPEMVFRENRNRQVGERAIVFWNVSSRTTLLVFDGARVRMSGFPNDTAWRRLEALTPEQISEEIRQYSQSHEIGISPPFCEPFRPEKPDGKYSGPRFFTA
jgi:hypothetical protein